MSDRPNSAPQKLSPILGLPVDDEPVRPTAEITQEARVTPLGEKVSFELSVIIPARNEEQNLPTCLESLLVQDSNLFPLGTDWELLVVDDHSTDRTRAIAQEAAARHSGLRVLEAPSLADAQGSFTGKTNACWFGAQHARGRWLLFTDADTLHEPNDLRHALHEVEKYKVVMLSYSPRQIVSGLMQRAVMPLIFSELASVYPPSEVNDPSKRTAAANGQFLLVERGAYFAIGGHRAVGGSVLEDVDFAWTMKRAKRPIRFRYAPDALSTRMYRGVGDMIEGWTKNLALLFPHTLRLAAWRLLDVLLFLLPLLLWLLPDLVLWQRAAIVLIWLRTVIRFYTRVSRSHFGFVNCALSLFGLPLFIALLVRSWMQHRVFHHVAWKGRQYHTGDSVHSISAASNLVRLEVSMILLTRKAEFSAAHFYFNPAWSEEENERVFGKCANRQGHGHNYTLEVTVAGEPDPVSGFVVDLKQLKDILEREAISVYDHRHLNHEVPEFASTVPTTENIAVAIWRRLDGKIPNAKLHRVRVYEMPDLFADFYGEGA